MKKLIAVMLSICMMGNLFPVQVFASERTDGAAAEESYFHNGAYTIGNNTTVNRLLEQSKFTARQGHGFAAEIGNNLIDRLKGANATVVGNDNVKNGADRLILGRDGSKIWIQDKYYNTARGSIEACFEDGVFRYLDAGGNAMQIEVPRDQYDEAVAFMREKIKSGQLKNAGVTDPDDAENLVRKGSLTYQQAVNLAKAGTVESLVYDAVTGTVSATCAFGISTLLVYSVSRLNGETSEKALKTAAMQGLKSGAVVFGTSVISSQLARTSLMKVFTPSSEALVKALGDDFASALLQSVGRETVGLSNEVLRSQAARILRSQALTAGVTIILLSLDDIVEILRGRISSQQLLKNLAVATAGVAGGYAGSIIGGAAGSAVAPGAGTAVGTVLGSVVIGGAIGYGTEKILGVFIEDDAEKMMDIIEDNFLRLGQEYLLSEEEATQIADSLQEKLTGETLKNMFASENQEEYARALMEPLMEETVLAREKMNIPTEAKMREELKASLKEVVFIH